VAEREYVYATSTVVTYIEGKRQVVYAGSMYDPKDPVVKRVGGFVSQDEWGRMNGMVVEQATAAPGEARNVKIPTKKTEKASK